MDWDETRIANFKELLTSVGASDTRAAKMIKDIPINLLLATIIVELKTISLYLREGFSIKDEAKKSDIVITE